MEVIVNVVNIYSRALVVETENKITLRFFYPVSLTTNYGNDFIRGSPTTVYAENR